MIDACTCSRSFHLKNSHTYRHVRTPFADIWNPVNHVHKFYYKHTGDVDGLVDDAPGTDHVIRFSYDIEMNQLDRLMDEALLLTGNADLIAGDF